MAVVLPPFLGRCLEKLDKLVTAEAVKILGVKGDLRRLQEQLKKINGVLAVADAERMRIQDSTVSSWLSDLKDVMYDIDDIIDLCLIKGRELLPGGGGGGGGEPRSSASSSTVRDRRGFPLPSCFTCVSSIPVRHEIGTRIQKLNQRLEEISKNKIMFSLQPASSPNVNIIGTQIESSRPPPTSDLSTLGLIGRKANFAAERLVESLVKAQEDTESILVFAIVGLGGIGKTALAQKIYNHQKVQAHFQSRLWLCVPESYSTTELLKQMVRSAGGDCGHAQSKGELQHLLISALAGKRFLVVLDDVWQADVWEDLLQAPLLHGGVSGSRVLVTSRKEDVGRSMRAIHTHRVDKLPPDDGWELLCKSVFGDMGDEDIPDLREVGIKLVDRCDGLPLAIKAIAGVLRTKDRRTSEWEKVHKSQAWSITGELPEVVRGALYLSYEDLPSYVEQCFLFCSLFPEDWRFGRRDLIRWWVAEGFIPAQGDTLLEDLAEDCYNNLVSRSLLHLDISVIDRNRCTMHDLTRSLVMFLSRDESCFLGGNESTVINNSLKIRRLALHNREETEVFLNKIENPQCLRTLLMNACSQVNTERLFQRFVRLRVLDLTHSKIESIPESIGSLQHLRYLDLDGTLIRKLPESIGCLINLQFLHLSRCQFLRTLPKSITQLCNLRRLGLEDTPISHVPLGIGNLHHLNDLDGFVVGEDNDNDHGNRQYRCGCGLNELQSMSQLKNLSISRLERVMTEGIQPLTDKPYLKKLRLHWSDNVDCSLISVRPEQICEVLSPPPSLEELYLSFFPGLRFPQWISNNSILPNLTYLNIFKILSCEQLPPLGQLPQLRYLRIQGAPAVVTIGPEFLGCGTTDGLGRSGVLVAFPKLEKLILISMPNWEEWTCDAEEVGDRRRATVKLLPRLQKLQIDMCPKLRALPEGLEQATALKTCMIEGTDSLGEIKNLHSLENLDVQHCPGLERISNLPALRDLRIEYSWGMMRFVENLNSLQAFTLKMTDDSIECLPEWLLGFIQQWSTSGAPHTFMFYCRQVLASKCSEGGEYWTLLNSVPGFTLRLL